MNRTIALMTDFGMADGYVGTMHGVILGINPNATIVDLSHEIAPQDVRQAAYVLYTASPYFPKGTIFVVVVDPGVGSERRAIALRAAGAYFVAPDNGVLSYVVTHKRPGQIVELSNPDYWLTEVSATFHGRDIFSPVGAHLSRGVPLENLGRPLDQIVSFSIPQPMVGADGSIEGHVLHIDRFGNVITDVRKELLTSDHAWAVAVGGRRVEGIRRTYATVERGALVALIGSEGHLEVAIRDGSAGEELNLRVGDPVRVLPS